jgi:O-antigen ligase
MILKDSYFKFYILLLIEMSILVFIAYNNYYAFQKFIWMISYLIISVSICLFVDDVTKLKKFITMYIIVITICALNQLLTGQRAYIGGRGFMGDTNDFALAMNVVAPISFFMGYNYRGMKRWIFWLLTLVFISANISTLSRGGFIGMMTIVFFSWTKTKVKAKSLIALLLLFIIIIALVPDQYKSEIGSIETEGYEAGTGRQRIEYWKVGWRMFLSNPIFGVGQGNQERLFEDYKFDDSGNSFWEHNMYGRTMHSIYFTCLVELGTIGILLWSLMLLTLRTKYKYIIKNITENYSDDSDSEFIKNCMYGLSIGLIGYLVGGIFLSAFYYPHFWHLSALMTSTCMIKTKMEEQQNY